MLVSIIVVTVNGLSFLQECLDAIDASSCDNYELLVVDNASTDGSVEYLKAWQDGLRKKAVFLDQNYGPCVARNIGVLNSTGDLLAFLDNDAAPTSDWLEQPLELFKSMPTLGIVQCRLIFKEDSNRIDSEGEYIDCRTGFLVQRVPFGSLAVSEKQVPDEIFAAKSAGMVVRRSAWDKVDGMDNSFFIYVEETDLAWRIRDAGYDVYYAPHSIVRHSSGGTSTIPSLNGKRLLRFHGPKNYLLLIIKNSSTADLPRLLACQIIAWVGFACFLFVTFRFQSAFWTAAGVGWVLANPRKAHLARCARLERVPRTTALLNRAVARRVSLTHHISKAMGYSS